MKLGISKDKKIKWEEWMPGQYTGRVDGERAFAISGHLCIQDLRGDGRHAPPAYSIKNTADGKRIAFDLLNGYNVKEHNANRRAWEEKERQSVKVLQDAEKFLKSFDKKEKAAKKKKVVKTTTSNANFVHVVPNSQFYTDLNQIKTTIESGVIDVNHILVGIKNSIKMGYKIVEPEPVLVVGDVVIYKTDNCGGIPIVGKIESIVKSDEPHKKNRFLYVVSHGDGKRLSTNNRNRLVKWNNNIE